MIHVVKEKHLNDFKFVHCVKPKDLYARLGHRQPNLEFDTQDEVVPMHMDKIQSIEYMENYDRMMQNQAHRESDGSDASTLGDNKPND